MQPQSGRKNAAAIAALQHYYCVGSGVLRRKARSPLHSHRSAHQTVMVEKKIRCPMMVRQLKFNIFYTMQDKVKT